MGNQSNGEITFATKLKTTLTEKNIYLEYLLIQIFTPRDKPQVVQHDSVLINSNKQTNINNRQHYLLNIHLSPLGAMSTRLMHSFYFFNV